MSVRDLFNLNGGKGTAKALLAVTATGGDGEAALSRRLAPNSLTIGDLVNLLLEANSTKRWQFLPFVTSGPIITHGKIEVVPIMSPSDDFSYEILVHYDFTCQTLKVINHFQMSFGRWLRK